MKEAVAEKYIIIPNAEDDDALFMLSPILLE